MKYPEEVKLVGCIYEDNLDANNLIKNQHVGARMKHIYVCVHFIHNLGEQGYSSVHFIKSEENSANILNEISPEKLRMKHLTQSWNGNLEC